MASIVVYVGWSRSMRIAVTGAAGFIGYHVAMALLREGHSIVCLDNLSRGSRSRFRELGGAGCVNVVGDVRRPGDVKPAVRGADAVVHLAALTSPEESFKDPRAYSEVNVLGTATVVKAALEEGVGRVVYASSAAVYGEPERLPIAEGSPARPATPYGATKLAGELMVSSLSAASGAEYVILRLFNVYGEGQDPWSPYSGVVARFVERACRGQPLIIYGDGGQVRDFVYVGDVAEAFKASLSRGRGVYNIASGRPTTIRQLADYVAGAKPGVRVVHASPRPGDVRRSYASIGKALRELGWRPRKSLPGYLKDSLKRC